MKIHLFLVIFRFVTINLLVMVHFIVIHLKYFFSKNIRGIEEVDSSGILR